MKTFLQLLAVLAALGSLPARATLFDFSYTDFNGAVAAGSFTGTQNGQFVDNVANVSMSVNGVLFNGSPNLFVVGLVAGNNVFPPVISFDATLNNFLFVDSDYPTDLVSYTNSFFMLNVPIFHETSISLNGAPLGAIRLPLVPENWSLTAAPIPEPETYVLLLAGLGLTGFAARRRRAGAA